MTLKKEILPPVSILEFPLKNFLMTTFALFAVRVKKNLRSFEAGSVFRNVLNYVDQQVPEHLGSPDFDHLFRRVSPANCGTE